MSPVISRKEREFVLASASRTRAEMLSRAGLNFRCDAADVDEMALKEASRARGRDAAGTALALAEAKAATVASRQPRTMVLGADQLLECEGTWFSKAGSREEARETLLRLSGRAHRLISGAVVVQDGKTLWQAVATAKLTMWRFDAVFVDSYLDRIGDEALTSVGAYKVEGPGIQLFERIEGNHFTILGLPLLPFLSFLRTR